MPTRFQDQATGRLDRMLRALTTRLGLSAVLGALLVACIIEAVQSHDVVHGLENTSEMVKDNRLDQGRLATLDILNLILLSSRGEMDGQFSPEDAQAFEDLTKQLVARVDAINQKRDDVSLFSLKTTAVLVLRRLIQTSRAATAAGYPDLYALAKDIARDGYAAMSYLRSFLEVNEEQSHRALEAQLDVAKRQQIIAMIMPVFLTLFGVLVLILLRREILERRALVEAERHIEYLAYFDAMTDLPNRSQFTVKMEGLLEQKRPVALLYIDLDDFKVVNDTFGHAAGDAVLRHVAGILARAAENVSGFTARLGGDEFALVIPDDDITRLKGICRTILKDAAEPFVYEREMIESGLSIGLATTRQIGAHSGKTLDILSRVTDFALYESKASGRNRVTVYDQDVEQRFRDRRSMLEDLPLAIENGDLLVYLQPKVTLSDEAIFGFEALVRWNRNGDIVPPGDFIALAEESGMVIDIDNYVLNRATELIADWNLENGTNFSVSVNLSAHHFTSTRILDRVKTALWQSNLPCHLLILEITETVQMRDWEQASRVILGLKDLGAKIAIDDFGAGFSSLAYLRAITAHELKIDRTLVDELETSEKARVLLRSVLDIAHNLGLNVTVEGVETPEQAEIVKNLGAEQGQGYLFGRPKPALDMLASTTQHLNEKTA